MSRTVLCCSLLLAASPAFACYTVTAANDRIVYHAVNPPVDMSRPIHETLPQVFPGGHMVFDLSTDCQGAAPVVQAFARRDPNVVVRVLAADGREDRVIPTGALAATR